MNTKTESVSSKNDDGASNGTSTSRRVAGAAHELIDDTAAKAEVVEEKLRNTATKTTDKVDASQEVATEQIDRTIKDVKGFVEGRPVAAAGIAFAAGVLATTILRR